jgi:hypothetical protein
MHEAQATIVDQKRGLMRRTSFARLLAVALMAGVFVCDRAAAGLAGQAASSVAGASADRFIGTWKLVGVETRTAKGEVVPPAAGTNTNRTGYLIYDPAGYMAAAIMPGGRKRNAGPTISDDEARAAIAGYTAYFGTFTVNAAEQFVTHNLQGSLNPGMAAAQKRFFELSGNRLTLKPPPAAGGNQARLTWERLPDVASPTAEHRKFLGFWKLVSSERRDDTGTLVSSNPGQTGYIIYTAAGFMMVQMVQPNRKPFAAAQPTPAEAGQAIRTYTNYFGPFYIHEADGYVVHDQVGTLNPGRIGPAPQQRFYEFTGRRLLLRPPPAFTPGAPTVQGTITWEKADPVRGTQ